METTFGAVWGATLALGLWLNRRKIAAFDEPAVTRIPLALEFALIAVHAGSLVAEEFIDIPWFAPIADLALPMGVIPILAVAGGRVWPYFMALPLTAAPICGKTVRNLGYEEHAVATWIAWVVYFAVPMAMATCLAVWLSSDDRPDRQGRAFPRAALLCAVWTFYFLNHAFFRFCWIWPTWQRTPNDAFYLLAALTLSWAVWRFRDSTRTVA